MRIGLKKILFSEIQQRGVIRLEEAYQLAHDNGFDYENAKRRMRELMNAGLVEPVLTEKRHIKAYRYCGKEPAKIKIARFPQIAMKLL